MEKEIKQRLLWVKLFEEKNDAGLVCRRCGISRPTLRKWYRRYLESGLAGLAGRSCKPFSSPQKKITVELENLVLELRLNRKIGARRIRTELKRLHEIDLSVASIHKILTGHQVKPLIKLRKKKDYIRYQRPTPGERVQLDTCQIAPGLIQYTAIDDCTRYRVLRVFPRRAAMYSLIFLEAVIEEMPFPIQRIQTDRGKEFFALKVQQMLCEYGIKFRPNKPASPHLNGKVERSQKTDKIEFYATIDLPCEELDRLLAEWQHYYNWERPHSSLGGSSPMERYFELAKETPFLDEVLAMYDDSKERVQEQNYALNSALRKLKQSL